MKPQTSIFVNGVQLWGGNEGITLQFDIHHPIDGSKVLMIRLGLSQDNSKALLDMIERWAEDFVHDE